MTLRRCPVVHRHVGQRLLLSVEFRCRTHLPMPPPLPRTALDSKCRRLTQMPQYKPWHLSQTEAFHPEAAGAANCGSCAVGLCCFCPVIPTRSSRIVVRMRRELDPAGSRDGKDCGCEAQLPCSAWPPMQCFWRSPDCCLWPLAAAGAPSATGPGVPQRTGHHSPRFRGTEQCHSHGIHGMHSWPRQGQAGARCPSPYAGPSAAVAEGHEFRPAGRTAGRHFREAVAGQDPGITDTSGPRDRTDVDHPAPAPNTSQKANGWATASNVSLYICTWCRAAGPR